MKPEKIRQKAILERISNEIANYGWPGKMVKQSITRQLAIGQATVQFRFVAYKGTSLAEGFKLIPDIAIRHEKLESLMAEIEGYTELGNTLGANLRFLELGHYEVWELPPEGDFSDAVSEILKCLGKYGNDFVIRYSDEEEILKLLCTFAMPAFILSPLNYVRGKKAMALTYLMGKGPEEVRNIHRKYLDFMKGNKELGLWMFEKFAADFAAKYKIELGS